MESSLLEREVAAQVVYLRREGGPTQVIQSHLRWLRRELGLGGASLEARIRELADLVES